MKRLTKYAIPKLGRGFPKKVPCFSDVIVKNQCPVMFCHKAEKCDSMKNRKCPYLQVMDKLAAYEDTGLEPEEIDSVFINGVIEENRRLKELAQAEKDGRLVVLEPNDPLTLEQLVEPVKVVCCKDCKHLYFKDFSAFCSHRVSACRPDGFCEYGERRKPEEGET